MINRVDIYKINNLRFDAYWECRIYIKGVGWYTKSHIPYSSFKSVRNAAIRIGLAGGWPVFDCTKKRKQIWPVRP